MSRFFALAILLVGLAGCGSSTSDVSVSNPAPAAATTAQQPVAEEESQLGLEVEPESVTSTYPVALSPDLLKPAGVSARVALPANATVAPIPPVQAQGSTGACVSFATGYELLSTAASQGRDLNDPQNQASSAWGYMNALNLEGKKLVRTSDGETPATHAADYLNTAVNAGAVSWAVAPFPSPTPLAQLIEQLNTVNTTHFQPTTQLQIGQWEAVTTSIESWKEQLAAGQPMSIGISVPKGMGSFKGSGVYAPANDTPTVGGHNIFLFGYDDSRHAFRLQNSWGKKWADGGQIWWDYDSLYHFAIKNGTHVAYPVSTEGVSPSTGSARVDQASGVQSEIVRTHQALAADGRVHFVALVRFNPAVRLDEFTLVSPGGSRLTSHHGFMLRSGYLHLSRKDGKQWAPGRYTLEMVATGPSGQTVSTSGSFDLAGLPGFGGNASEQPDTAQGANGQPVTVH